MSKGRKGELREHGWVLRWSSSKIDAKSFEWMMNDQLIIDILVIPLEEVSKDEVINIMLL